MNERPEAIAKSRLSRRLFADVNGDGGRRHDVQAPVRAWESEAWRPDKLVPPQDAAVWDGALSAAA
jgi:hypothetical protein